MAQLVLGEAPALGRIGIPLIPAPWGTCKERTMASDQQVTTELPAMVRQKSRDTEASNSGMRGRELRVILLSPL